MLNNMLKIVVGWMCRMDSEATRYVELALNLLEELLSSNIKGRFLLSSFLLVMNP